MIDPRIYRAALLPVVIALIVVAFSLESRPLPLRTTFAPQAFDGARAAKVLNSLAAEFPSRRPGSPGDDALARRVADELRAALPKVRVQSDSFRAETIDGDQTLTTVTAQQPGSGARAQIVVVAHRDATGAGSAAQLSGTAAMLEIARDLASARPTRSVTFASVSGGTGGLAGMRDLIGRLARPVDAIIELGDLAGPVTQRPLVVAWANGVGAAPLRLQRTVALALRQETGVESTFPFARTQLARFAFPLSVSGQGVADSAGIAAVRLSASGELPPPANAPVSAARLDTWGRGALRALTALDSGPRIPQAPERDLAISRKVMPGWAVRLLVFALLLPALLTLIDGLARLRRRGEPIARWIGWILALSAPFALAGGFAIALARTGAIADLSPPPPPGALPAGGSGWAAIGCTALVFALGVLVLRPLLVRAAGAAGPVNRPGARIAPAVVACVAGLVAWALNPYAALLLVLPANLWLLAGAREVGMRRVTGLAVVLLSLLPIVLVPVVYAEQLDMGVGEFLWFWMLVLAGGQGGAPGDGRLEHRGRRCGGRVRGGQRGVVAGRRRSDHGARAGGIRRPGLARGEPIPLWDAEDGSPTSVERAQARAGRCAD